MGTLRSQPPTQLLDRQVALWRATDAAGAAEAGQDVWQTIVLPEVSEMLSPILYALPAQMLAYYAAIAKGTDVDQPRNLAKSVTVE